MTFPPATPMSFARILEPRPGYTYDRVTYPNLPQFAETLTYDRYTGNGQICAPFARCWPEYPQNCESLRTSPLGGLGMLTVPVSWGVRAAANGLGSLLGLGLTADEREARRHTTAANTGYWYGGNWYRFKRLAGLGRVMTHDERVEAERISAAERARIARDYGSGSNTGGGSSGTRAPLPPGTTKTPWESAVAAAGNIFGTGTGTPALPPGTHAEGEAGDGGETTNASPPINNSGAPNWGLYVGLAVAAVAAVALVAVISKKGAVSNRRRNRRRNSQRQPVNVLHVDYADIRALRREAAEAGDLAQVKLCERALRGEPKALQKCARVIRDGQG